MRKYRGSIARVLLAVFLLMCLVLPCSVAYAETPLSVDVVAAAAANEGLGSPFQHHTFIDDGVMWVFYLASSANQIAGMWSEDGTTWVAIAPIQYCNGSTAETPGGQFDTWYYPNDSTVHFAVVNTSANNSNILFAKYAVDPALHTLTIDGSWVTAVSGVANVSYRNPTICVNNDQDFITYGNISNNISDVWVTSTNDSTGAPWTPATGFPMYNLSATGNKSEYGSVIPLYSSNNVSVQWATSNGTVEHIEQAAIYWNGSSWVEGANYGIDTSGWYCPSDAEWNYNAISIPTAININDVAIQSIQTNGSSYRVFFNRRANESDAWGTSGYYARNFGVGGWAYDYVGAMGIRNAIYALTYSGWDMSGGSTAVYSNDFDATTGNWAGIANVATDVEIPYVSTMSDYTYDPSGTGYLGFIFGNQNNDLMYGLYGPATPATPSTIPTSVTTMAWIVVLVLGALICLILLAYGASESIKGGSTEFIKIGVIGLITIIIAATIVAALL
jgi:hypothetical protein